ncbi:MAG: metalloregulator ArsR/SmtB family transcription factor [bacterium]|nr:metalloregulator ArsR/SmtB family transcription factor [bacterium]
MNEMEKLLKAIANGRRLAILKYLARVKKASVGDISENIKLSFRATSQHLNILKQADILEKKQEGLIVWHTLSVPMHSIISKLLKFL